jgi:hypothetical protein
MHTEDAIDAAGAWLLNSCYWPILYHVSLRVVTFIVSALVLRVSHFFPKVYDSYTMDECWKPISFQYWKFFFLTRVSLILGAVF